jgi:uncharacterized membrane protein YhhN
VRLWHNVFMTLTAALTGFALVALLLAEWREFRPGVWIAKPLASLGLVLVAWSAGALTSDYGRCVSLALCLCALGDVLLIPRANGTAFLLGIGSFALGHACYAWAFYSRGTQLRASLFAFAAMAVIVALVLRWLRGYLPEDMRAPVRVYMFVIATMVAFAVGASVASGDRSMALAAIAFAASDLSVARERFVRASFVNLLWGLPLYYAAQLLLAWSAGAAG